ncbi:ROK family protein [Candidatus Woesearchaeota archaeon]|nr:ROK family protein [Candidatus Woesearchaeota archaeon]
MNLIIGVDIGGTNIRAGLVTSSGKVKKRAEIATGAEKGRDEILKRIFRLINKFMEKDVIGIGVGIAGPVDPYKGLIIDSPNIPEIKGLELKKVLEEKYKCLVKVDNDANCFALGEAVFGAGNKSKYVIGVTLGTGLGGGIVINKELYHGIGSAGELGHMSINFDGLESKTGNTGAAEEYLSKRALERMGEILNVKTPKALFDMAEKKSALARNRFKEYGYYLGIFITNLIHIFDPDCIVIGGNISDSWKYFNKSMFSEIKRRALFNHAKIVRRKLGDDSAVMGAASLLVKREVSKDNIKTMKKRWGEYKRFSFNEKSTVRIVDVKPGHILNLRSHKNRDELWYAIDEGLQVQIDDNLHTTKKGDTYLIPRGAKHRVIALKQSGRILEICFGQYDPEDVVMYKERKGMAVKK